MLLKKKKKRTVIMRGAALEILLFIKVIMKYYVVELGVPIYYTHKTCCTKENAIPMPEYILTYKVTI